MLSMTEIRKGKLIVLDGQPFQVMSADYLRKQQRRPVMRTTLKNIQTGQTKEHSFQQSDKVGEADVTRTSYQFLYANEDSYAFMNQETYDQVELEVSVLGEDAKYLLEGQDIDMVEFEGKPIGVELPIKIDRTVIEAPPGVKGDTSTNVMKDVIVEGNLKVKAPLFVKPGDKIRIDTRTGAYAERA